jgi:type II secretory pathway component GspD/PulD (secretin)
MAFAIPRHTFAGFILALAPALAFAAPVPSAVQNQEAPAAEKVKKQLDQQVTLEATDQSLNAALNRLREQTKIYFVVDRQTLQQMGLDPEQLHVSVKLNDVKARSCLRSLLAPYNLGYAIVGDTVLVTSDDMAMHRQLQQRVSLDLDKVELAAALKKLAKETAANVVLDSKVPAKEAKTPMSLEMDDVPLETAVKLLAESAGLKPVKVGNVLLVTTKARAAELRSDPDLNPANNVPQPNMAPQQMNQWMMLQQLQGAQAGQIFLQGMNINGMPMQGPQGNVPIPPLEKPAEKSDSPDEDKPAPPEKKTEPVKPGSK